MPFLRKKSGAASDSEIDFLHGGFKIPKPPLLQRTRRLVTRATSFISGSLGARTGGSSGATQGLSPQALVEEPIQVASNPEIVVRSPSPEVSAEISVPSTPRKNFPHALPPRLRRPMREHGCLDLEALNTEVLRQNWFRSNERDAEQLQTPSPTPRKRPTTPVKKRPNTLFQTVSESELSPRRRLRLNDNTFLNLVVPDVERQEPMKPSHQKKDGGVYWLFPVDKPTTIASDTTVHNQPSSSLVSPPSKAQDSAKAEEQEVDQLLDGNDDQPEIVSTLEKEHDVLLNSNESHVATLDTSRSGKRARESDVEDDDHHSFGSSSRSSTPKRRRLTRSTSPSTSIAPDSPRSMAPSPSPRLGESPRRSNIHKLLHPSSAPHSKHSVTSSVDTPVSPIKSKNPTIYPAVPVPNSALKSTIPENVPTSQAQPLPVLPPTPKTPDDLKVQKASTASTTLPSAPMDVTKSGSSKKRRGTKRPREEDSEELEAAQSSPRYITRSHTEGRSGAKRTKVYKC